MKTKILILSILITLFACKSEEEIPNPPKETPNLSSLSDTFEGDGDLLGYVTNNASVLPDVKRKNGRYRANLVDNTDNKTVHFNKDQGRLDAKKVKFPFEFIARNIGIGTQEDSQKAPSASEKPFLFAGIQVHVLDLNTPTSSHVVVGHRGGEAQFTIEGKNTVNGSSSVDDIGSNQVPNGRADIKIVGDTNKTLTVYWKLPNSSEDTWKLYNRTGKLPGRVPSYDSEVYVGLITYAYQLKGLPFVGTCDAVEVKEL